MNFCWLVPGCSHTQWTMRTSNVKADHRVCGSMSVWFKTGLPSICLFSVNLPVEISLPILLQLHLWLNQDRIIFSSSPLWLVYNSIFLIKQIGIQLKNIVALSAMQHHHNSPCYIDGHGHIDILTHLGWYDVIMMKLKSVTDSFTTLVILF